jgi:metal-sulfur cluster biosynthetic enzyme
MSALINANPIIYNVAPSSWDDNEDLPNDLDESFREQVTKEEVFSHIRNINDPEHPLTLEQLNVVSLDHVEVSDQKNRIVVRFTPTIPHCSMATLIGLCIRVKLFRSLPSRFKVLVEISPGAHNTEKEINKQLADKERVAAALENSHLLEVVDKCLFES